MSARPGTSSRIYGLFDPRTEVCRYVGKTIQPLGHRLQGHITKARTGRTTTPAGDWIRELLAAGVYPVARVLAEVPPDASWQTVERVWIRELRALGATLTNIRAGGNGAHARVALPDELRRLFGVVSDAQLGEQAGLTREAIKYHRTRAGVPATTDRSQPRPNARGRPAHNRVEIPEELMQQLGVWPDTEIARRAGVSKVTIRNRRRALGIKASAASKLVRRRGDHHPNAKLTSDNVEKIRELCAAGDLSLREVAAMFGVTTYAIRARAGNAVFNLRESRRAAKEK